MCKLQVGLLGSARGLQKDLEKIAGRADTNTPDGLHYVLQGMTFVYLLMPRLSLLIDLGWNALTSKFVGKICACVMAGSNTI